MPRTNQAYPPEFRREAIRLVRASDEEHPIPRIAREIGVSDGTLRSWVNQDEIDSGEREGLTTEEKEELHVQAPVAVQPSVSGQPVLLKARRERGVTIKLFLFARLGRSWLVSQSSLLLLAFCGARKAWDACLNGAY